MNIHIGFIGLIRSIGIVALLFTLPSAAPVGPERTAPKRIVYYDNSHYPPFSMLDSKGTPAGFNIDLIRAMAKELDIQVEIRLLPWNQVRSALETEHTADVSAMFNSAERDRIFDFSTPLTTVVHEIFLRKGSETTDTLEKLSGKDVLVEDRSHSAEYLGKYYPEIHLIPVDSEPEALRLLAAGKADAAIASQSGGYYGIAQARLTDIVPADLPVLPTNYSFAVLDGRSELLNEINRGLARVRRSGEYAKLYSKWLGANPPGISTGIPWKYAVVGGSSAVLLTCAILAWIWSLRRQVAEKTRWLRAELRERERAERWLRESEAKLQTILDHSSAVIFLKDLEGRYLLVNRVFIEIVGKESSEIIGRTDWELFPENHAHSFVENDRKVLFTNVPITIEETYDLRGLTRTFLNVKFPIRDTTGKIQALGGVATDITERKCFEYEIQSAREAAERANRAKDQFLAVLSHELRTPLTPVLAAVTDALSSRLPDELHSLLKMIQRNIELEARLIEDLLDLTRLVRGKLSLNVQTSDAHELIRQAAAICDSSLAAKQQRVRFEFNATQHYVDADPARLQQVFWNLLQNSIKFSPTGSEVAFRTFNRDNGQLVIQCTDRGIGMEREVLDRIFRPFEQVESSLSRHNGGLGLGLAISRMIIEAHHGIISADSAGCGSGSTFTIRLPTVAAPQINVSTLPPEAMPERAERLHILLVENSEDTRRVLAKILRAKGHVVETAESVADAKRLWHQNSFDLLLSDIGLPDATGLELAAELRSEGPLRAIAFSGYGSEEDIRKSKDAGFAEHLVKPLDINQLKLAVTRVMSTSPVRSH